MNVAVTATFKTVGLLFVELNMKQIWAAWRIGQCCEADNLVCELMNVQDWQTRLSASRALLY